MFVSGEGNGELELWDASVIDGIGPVDDDALDPVGPSAVLDVQPVTNAAVATRHPAMRGSAGRGLFMSRSPQMLMLEAVGLQRRNVTPTRRCVGEVLWLVERRHPGRGFSECSADGRL